MVSMPAPRGVGAARHLASLVKALAVLGAASGRLSASNAVDNAVPTDHLTRARTHVIQAHALIGHHA
jgi:hypothetical protein